MKLFKDHFQTQLNNKIKQCDQCHLKDNAGPVLGYGSTDADVMFIADFPQESDAKAGVPFIGKAKPKILKTIKDNDLKKGDYYFTYLIKHTITGSKDISGIETPKCLKHLLDEIEIINPKIICSMGFFVTTFLSKAYNMDTKYSNLKDIHGDGLIIPEKKKRNKLLRPMRYLIPTWSPSAKHEVIHMHFEKDVQTIKTIRSLYPLLF